MVAAPLGIEAMVRRYLFVLASFSAWFGLGCGGGSSTGSTTPTQNPAPTLTSVSPTSATVGSAAVTLTATGTGFISGSTIQWNGTALATSYLSSTSVTAQIPASDLIASGTATITVQNPAPGGGISSSLTFNISPPPNPAPTLSSISPTSASAGSAALTLTATGTGFISSSTIQWNETALATSYVSSTSVTAQVPASDLTAPGTAAITVQNPMPGGGDSSGLTFSVNSPVTSLNVLDVEGNDIALDASRGKLYVAVPSSASTNPGTVTVVDPIAGAVVSSQQLASAPTGFAISDDDQYLYAVIDGGATIDRLVLPALTLDINWSLGTDSLSGQPNLAGNIQVQPGAAHTLAASFGEYGSGSVAVYDDGVKRSSVQGGLGNSIGNSLQWAANGNELYAAWGVGSDATYYTTVSDSALFTMPVTANGVGAVTTYNSDFRGEGVHLQLDPVTGYAYNDIGEVVDTSNGIPVGEYPSNPAASHVFPGQLAVVDSKLHRFYALYQVWVSAGNYTFHIDVFDQTHFRLLETMIIPNAQGTPTNFIRWGQAGLAFVTNSPSASAPGKLYIVDGSVVNPGTPPDTVAGSTITAVPTLTAISPLAATAGAQGVTLAVTGRDFTLQSTVYWNGAALPTTETSATALSAQIPAADLASVTQATITVSNAGADLPASSSLPFSVNPAPPAGNQISVYSTGGNGLVWDPIAARIYVSMPGIQGDNGNSVAVVDPLAGTVSNSGFLGSDPDRISLSENSQYLYIGMDGANAIEQLALPGFNVNASWNLGSDSFEGPYYALSLQAAPAAAQTTAVALGAFNISPASEGVVIYDGATPRPTTTKLPNFRYPYSSLQWAGNDSTLYSVDGESPQDFLTLGVSPSGVVLAQHDDALLQPYSSTIHYDPGTGLVYADGGQVIQPSSGTIAGSFGASGIAVPDSTLNRVFILGQTTAQSGTSSYTIESFDQKTFASIGAITIDNVVGVPTGLIRWGSNGLAFTTITGFLGQYILTGPGQLYVIAGSFVNPSGSESRPATKGPLLPVRKTWDLNAVPTNHHVPPVVHASPLKQ
jgi:hypothetical protein